MFRITKDPSSGSDNLYFEILGRCLAAYVAKHRPRTW